MLLRFFSITLFAISFHGATAPAWSEVIWQDGTPIFQSDRRTYRPRQARPVIRQYPKLMSGGPRPFIAPRQPSTITFPNSEPVGTVIIDTDLKLSVIWQKLRVHSKIGCAGFNSLVLSLNLATEILLRVVLNKPSSRS